MSEESPSVLRRMNCPSCGAPIAFYGDETVMQCPYCKVGIERTLPKRAKEPKADVQPQVSVAVDQILVPLANTTAASSRATTCSGVVFTFFIFLLVGGISAAVYFLNPDSPGSLNPRPLQVYTPVTLVASGLDGPADIVGVTYDYNAEDYAVTRLTVTDQQILWRTGALDSSSDVRSIAVNSDKLFMVENDSQLKAYDLADGSFLWQANLADKLGYSDTCLSVRGDRVVALTQDYTLQAFDAITGDEVWNRRLNGYTSEFIQLEKSVAVIDDVDDQTSMFFLDLSDGSERLRLTPRCESLDNYHWSSDLGGFSNYIFEVGEDQTLDTGSVYFLYGHMPSCIERWDVSKGELLWQTVLDDDLVPSLKDTLLLVTSETVYYAESSRLWALDQDSQERKLLLEVEDYEPLPLAFVDDVLVVRALRTRGTQRFELWGIDPVMGEQVWKYDLGDNAPFQPPDNSSGSLSDGESAWAWKVLESRLFLVIAESDPNQFVTKVLDPSDGTSVQTHITPFETWSEDTYWISSIDWRDSLFWANVASDVLVLNVETGMIDYSYP